MWRTVRGRKPTSNCLLNFTSAIDNPPRSSFNAVAKPPLVKDATAGESIHPAYIPKSGRLSTSNRSLSGITSCFSLNALTRIADSDTPHSPKVRPSGANIAVQSNEVSSIESSLGSMLIACSTAAAISSSVTSVVWLSVGEIITGDRKLVIEVGPH